ncbi:WXG100 family type VII secretion target [Streptomyces sp. NPDC020983]|uniref:WXG100 family type VII secretion target n=1 Tax=Streptomyces sp. NPDC020983 TaxID=3365106 RepID=UPI003794C736
MADPSSIGSARIKVDDSLSAAGTTINGMAATIAEELHALKGRLAPLEQEWLQSSAATYYQDMMNEWDLAADGLLGPQGVLGRIAHAMHVNWGNYADAEWSNVSTWKH